MRHLLVTRCLTIVVGVALVACRRPAAVASPSSTPAVVPPPASAAPVPSTDTTAAARDRMVADVLRSIAGHESEPAGQVFQNVKMFTQMPARQLLAVMNLGYGRSLGVTCAHCHVAGEWASDAKPQKQIARDMARMVGTINGTLLKEIPNLRTPNPLVNCTTCHRGAIRPALNLSP